MESERNFRGGRYREALETTGLRGVGFAEDPAIALHREIAALGTRLDHLLPLVGKVDQMKTDMHGLGSTLAEVKVDLRHLSSTLNEVRASMADGGKQRQNIFWARVSALAAAVAAGAVLYQVFSSGLPGSP